MDTTYKDDDLFENGEKKDAQFKAEPERSMSMNDFEQIVIYPVEAAYRLDEFLTDSQKEFWYQKLKDIDRNDLCKKVDRCIKYNEKIPVFANIYPYSAWDDALREFVEKDKEKNADKN